MRRLQSEITVPNGGQFSTDSVESVGFLETSENDFYLPSISFPSKPKLTVFNSIGQKQTFARIFWPRMMRKIDIHF